MKPFFEADCPLLERGGGLSTGTAADGERSGGGSSSGRRIGGSDGLNASPRPGAFRFVFLFSFVAACVQTVDAPCVHTPPLSWDNFGEGFMEQNCLGCHSSYLSGEERHGAPEGVDFNTYADVITWVDRIDARATGEDADMPPGGSVSAEDKALLEEWLLCAVYPDAEAIEENAP